MKIRNGFVSNSSSANFIVHWRYRNFGQNHSLKKILTKLYDIDEVYNELNDSLDWSKSFTKYDKDEISPWIDRILEDTKQNSDGTFTTRFFTSMRNSSRDFGPIAAYFLLSLAENDELFQLLDATTELE